MLGQRVYHVVHPEAHDKRHPQGEPDQHDICDNLQEALATARKRQQVRSNFTHNPLNTLNAPDLLCMTGIEHLNGLIVLDANYAGGEMVFSNSPARYLIASSTSGI